LDKTIRGIETEETKTKRLIKAAAKRNDMDACKILSKEILRARKVKNRVYTSKAQLNSLVLMMQQQLATIKVTGSLEKSADIMALVNKMVKLPEISNTMQELSKEMLKVRCIKDA
jgi:charged multivesicular body protein 3